MNARPVQAAGCTWTGAASINWSTAGNWSGCHGTGGSPAITDGVIIPAVTNKPRIDVSSITIASLLVDTNSSLILGNDVTMSVPSFIVSGSTNLNGHKLTLNNNTWLAVGGANSEIKGTGTLIISPSSAPTVQVSVGGNIRAYSEIQVNSTTTTFRTAGTGTISGSVTVDFGAKLIADPGYINSVSGDIHNYGGISGGGISFSGENLETWG
jgi:hypothetical protein